MKRRHSAYIGTKNLHQKHPCPNCLKGIDGVTSVSLRLESPEKVFDLKGKFTMCIYCGALLTFADNKGRMRIMTAEERADAMRLHPTLQNLVDQWRREKVPNFARKNFFG
jgi:hypothetical protein